MIRFNKKGPYIEQIQQKRLQPFLHHIIPQPKQKELTGDDLDPIAEFSEDEDTCIVAPSSPRPPTPPLKNKHL